MTFVSMKMTFSAKRAVPSGAEIPDFISPPPISRTYFARHTHTLKALSIDRLRYVYVWANNSDIIAEHSFYTSLDVSTCKLNFTQNSIKLLLFISSSTIKNKATLFSKLIQIIYTCLSSFCLFFLSFISNHNFNAIKYST